MRLSVVRRLIFVGAVLTILALPVVGYAQEAVLGGTVTDTTGAVLPGVTVRALLEATGNTFDTVSDTRGAYQMSVCALASTRSPRNCPASGPSHGRGSGCWWDRQPPSTCRWLPGAWQKR
jgi:hypothetical protein